ncbi:molybdate ABC transporter substrate-binding protein [Ferrovibrio sp.]|uniref:molybdate ABC transporter substrate-binding protein n=1 Tax=Ferrovibrio sp. TaxID=1917215 RepID=UPI001B6C2D8B|nr:molybdate ABC transporter substrate-binding protein [Ferrovibrio sp.]MBP7065368.1 molybdate ABC transporter substrate-binding protein [Ferrovibrio sp.]
MLAEGQAMAQEAVRVYAAGSLRAVMTEIGAAFRADSGISIAGTYGASGLLRERIAKGETAEIFASANMQHPQQLSQSGSFGPTRLFTRNEMCALVHPAEPANSETLLTRMLDNGVRLGTSTPKADPSGDYAFEVFAKAETMRPGARAKLEAKALQLTGGPNSPPPPPSRNVYGMLVEQGHADIFLTYCTNAVLARREVPALRQVALPQALAVGADYGLAVARNARGEVQRFADFILSRQGQAILSRHGFAAIAP